MPILNYEDDVNWKLQFHSSARQSSAHRISFTLTFTFTCNLPKTTPIENQIFSPHSNKKLFQHQSPPVLLTLEFPHNLPQQLYSIVSSLALSNFGITFTWREKGNFITKSYLSCHVLLITWQIPSKILKFCWQKEFNVMRWMLLRGLSVEF